MILVSTNWWLFFHKRKFRLEFFRKSVKLRGFWLWFFSWKNSNRNFSNWRYSLTCTVPFRIWVPINSWSIRIDDDIVLTPFLIELYTTSFYGIPGLWLSKLIIKLYDISFRFRNSAWILYWTVTLDSNYRTALSIIEDIIPYHRSSFCGLRAIVMW